MKVDWNPDSGPPRLVLHAENAADVAMLEALVKVEALIGLRPLIDAAERRRPAALTKPDHASCMLQKLGVDTTTGLAYEVYYCPVHDERFKRLAPFEQPTDD